MSENRRYYWLKLQETFFEDDTIDFIESQENGEKYVLFYLKLCLKALKNEGKLIRYVGELLMPYDEAGIAKLTNTDIDTVRSALMLFSNIGLIKRLETGEIYLTQINELIGTETSAAQRKRKQRINEKMKLECDIVTPMSQIGHTDIEKEIDKDIKSIDIEEEVSTGIDTQSSQFSFCKLQNETTLTDTKSAKKQKSKRVSKSQENKNYLDSVSDDIRNQSELLTIQMLSAFKVLDPHYERSKAVLLSWQVDFAKFLSESKRKLSEVESVLNYALSDSFWTTRIFKPENFITSYQTLYRQYNKPLNKQSNTFYKNFDKEALKDKDFFSDLEEFRNGTAN